MSNKLFYCFSCNECHLKLVRIPFNTNNLTSSWMKINGSFCTRFANTLNTNIPRDARNVKYVRIGQMNTFLGVGTACKFDSGA